MNDLAAFFFGIATGLLLAAGIYQIRVYCRIWRLRNINPATGRRYRY